MAKDYTIGKGKLLFKESGGLGFLDLGNCPDFTVTLATEKLEHFSSRSGLQVKDKEVVTKQTATCAFTLDEPNMDNLNLFVMGDGEQPNNQTGGSVVDQSVTAVHDLWLDLGKKEISAVVVTSDPAGTTYVEDTDYEVDYANGLLKILSTGSIGDSDPLLVDYDYAAVTISEVRAAQASKLEGDLLFLGDPPAGRKLDVRGYASLAPEGDLAFIGEDWLQFGFTGEFLDNVGYTGLFEIVDKGSI